jgi:hypothetical protein
MERWTLDSALNHAPKSAAGYAGLCARFSQNIRVIFLRRLTPI